ncbi:MAG TPA: hypothetical protein VMV41_14260 [Cellulomonadaceae bacterium]|nr:hypothetical protein [Cellulomonadaceae bacterium]
MSNVLHPVGPRPSRVYWVRRIVVVAVLVAVVAVVVVLVRLAIGRSTDGAVTGARASSSTTATTPASGTPQACPASAIGLAVTADATTYGPGVNPTFTVTVTNTGTQPCTLDAGEAARQVVVTSGADRIWSSADCANPATATKLLLLDAGQPYEAAVPWARVRSAVGCPTGLPTPRAGTYQATATLAGRTSAPLVMTLK